MAAGRDLADGLAAVASRYTPDARKAKLELLGRLETARVGPAAALLRLHEALCFLQAYPDDAEVLARVDRALAAFSARVTRLGAPARRRLHDAGVADATLDYPFAFPMARWLARRFPRDAEVAWGRFEEVDRLDETLSLLASPAEGDAFSEGGMGWRRWLRVAKGGRRMTDLALLLELFERARLPTETRDWLWENLRLPILWTPRGPGASRTLARLPPARVFFHADGLSRPAAPLTRALAGPLPVLRPAPRALAETLIDAARVAMATRQRELHAFSYPNPDDVLVMDGDRGLRLAFFGIAPGFRLPLEGYYAFLALKNGVPVSYGAGWELFGTLDFAINIFASFRQGSRRCSRPSSCGDTAGSSGCGRSSSIATSSATRARKRCARARSISITGSASARATRRCSACSPVKRRASPPTGRTGRRSRCSNGWPAARSTSRSRARTPSRSIGCAPRTWLGSSRVSSRASSAATASRRRGSRRRARAACSASGARAGGRGRNGAPSSSSRSSRRSSPPS